MRSVRALLAGLLGVVPFTAIGPVGPACAAEGPEATLVIETGSGSYTYCVALDAEQVSGLRVIELAAAQHGLDYRFGYGGQAVCRLAGVGSAAERCFQGGEPFWGYWRATSGGWSWSGTGAASTTVEDGDVEGWAWGTGGDGSTHPQPPVTSHEAVCGPDEPDPKGTPGNGGKKSPKERDRQRSSGSTDEDTKQDRSDAGEGGHDRAQPAESQADDASQDPAPTETADEDKKRKRRGGSKDGKRRERQRSSLTVAPSTPGPTPTIAAPATPAAAPVATSSGGPPIAGVIGLLATVLLGIAGAWFLKRRSAATG